MYPFSSYILASSNFIESTPMKKLMKNYCPIIMKTIKKTIASVAPELTNGPESTS